MAVRTVAEDLSELDLGDPQTFIDLEPVDIWRWFRANRPVHWNNGSPGFWALSKHADVLAVYKDNERFTSERGNVLATLLQGSDSASGKMLAVTDGPRHRAVRNLMLKSFSPRVLGRVAEAVRERTFRLLTDAVGMDEFDLATDVADHIPINTIGDLMDIPNADRQRLVDWNNQSLSRYSAEHTETDEWLARNEILLYFSELAERRRAHPGDDVVSALANGIVDGKPLSEAEIVFNCYSLILGADESSRMSSIGAVLALANHPDQWKTLKDGEVGLDTATEEVLRWTTPAMHFGRRALVDVPLRDQVIAAGDVVSLWNTSANFDEEVFPDSERFDLARTPNKHVTFGYGPHFCIGAFLGRVHVSAILGGLRDLVGGIRLTAPAQRLHSNFVYGYHTVPVSFVPEL
jgi:cytochrome P450